MPSNWLGLEFTEQIELFLIIFIFMNIWNYWMKPVLTKNLYTNHSNKHSNNQSEYHSNKMANINLPKDMLEKEAFKTLPAKEKEEYVTNLLKKILDINEDGITISQIKEATGLTYSTIWHHLEILSCTAQAHKISRGNLDVYYHNGTATDLNESSKGEVKYGLSLVKNKEGNFVCIHEKRQNRMGNHTICKGINLPVELLGNFIAELDKVKNSFSK